MTHYCSFFLSGGGNLTPYLYFTTANKDVEFTDVQGKSRILELRTFSPIINLGDFAHSYLIFFARNRKT